jgi:hypothetical protein
MFERFDEPARAAVHRASLFAGHCRHNHIGTAHLLFGVVAVAGQDLAPTAGDVIIRLGSDPQSIRDLILDLLVEGNEPTPGHIPFTPNVKAALERAVASADAVGSNHVGAEHLLAGMAANPDSTAGSLLSSLSITDADVLSAITDTAMAPSPTSARTDVVYLPVGKSIFKNGGKIYPDLAAALAAHPDQEVTPFPLSLADGEYFTLIVGHNARKPVASFASYKDAFAAAESFRETQGVTPTIRIMAPTVTEHRGKDAAGRDTVLGRTVSYEQVSVMARVVTPTLHPVTRKVG